MTSSEFKKKLRDHGFLFRNNVRLGSRFLRAVGNVNQHIALVSVRGCSWRLFLAVGEPPERWPFKVWGEQHDQPWIEGESPWFPYSNDLDGNESLDQQCDTREAAREKCFAWLTAIGFEWLGNPEAKSPDEWRTAYDILVRFGPTPSATGLSDKSLA
jgi:hypothetical protein